MHQLNADTEASANLIIQRKKKIQRQANRRIRTHQDLVKVLNSLPQPDRYPLFVLISSSLRFTPIWPYDDDDHPLAASVIAKFDELSGTLRTKDAIHQ